MSLGPATSARTALTTDLALLKVAQAPEWVRIRRAEVMYQRAMYDEWTEKSNAAITSVLARVPRERPLTAADTEKIPDRLINAFKGWPSKSLKALAQSAVEDIYRLGQTIIFKKRMRVKGYDKPIVIKASLVAEIVPAFNLVDEAAVDYLKGSQLFWMANHYGADTVDAIKAAGWEELQGLSKKVAGDKLREIAEKIHGVGAFAGKSSAYFEGVAVNAATTARVTGSLLEMRKLGVTRYTVNNPMDDRTSQICEHLHGKSFEVQHAIEQVDKLLSASSPADIKNIQGWNPTGFKDAFAKMGIPIAVGTPLPAGSSGKVVEQGFGFPPYHFNCRSMVDIAEDAEFLPPPAGEALETLPSALPSPLPSGAISAAPAHAPGGFPFALEEVETIGDGAHLGGMHSKAILKTPDGDQWMFKPYSHRPVDGVDQTFRAFGDKAAADFAKAIGHPAAETHVITLPAGHPALKAMNMGRTPVTGSIQRMATKVKGSIGSTPINTLSKPQWNAVQREHIFDWMISNHDSHKDNLLIVGKEVLGIDKGQTFRFFGKDTLNILFHPNPEASYYNSQFQRYARGGFGPDFFLTGPNQNPAMRKMIDSIQKMPDDKFIAIFMPYVDEASKAGVKWNGMGRDAFIEKLLARKNALRTTMDDFYTDIEKQRRNALGLTSSRPKAPKAPKAPPSTGVLTPIDDKLVKDIHESGVHGKAVYIGSRGQTRSDEVLFYGMKGDGTVGEMYLNKSGHAALKSVLQESLNTSVGRLEVVRDVYIDQMNLSMKAFSARLGNPSHSLFGQEISTIRIIDFKVFYKQLKQDKFKSDAARYYLDYLTNVVGVNKTAAEVDAMSIEQAREWLKTLKFADIEKNKTYVTAYVAPASAPKPVGIPGFSVREIETRELSVRLGAGEVNFDSFNGPQRMPGKTYEITVHNTKNPVRIEYAHQDGGNAGSKDGRFRLFIDKDSAKLTAADIQEAQDVLKRFGLNAELAKDADVEALYLIKVTQAAKLRGTGNFRFDESMSSDEIVERLSRAWSEKLGVKDVRALDNYQPKPFHDWGGSPKFGQYGHGRWERFDFTLDDVKKSKMELHTSMNSDGQSLQFFQNTVPGKTNAFISNETKQRLGLPPSGASPKEDMRGGGALNVYTRVRTVASRSGLTSATVRFNHRLMLDPDSQHFSGDLLGKARERAESVRASTLDEMVAFAKDNRSDNEFLSKHAIHWRHIEAIGVYNEREKQDLIKLLKEAGLEDFAGGKDLNDVIVVTNAYNNGLSG